MDLTNHWLDRLKNGDALQSLKWFDPPYIGDWCITALLWFTTELVERFDVFERSVSSNDPLISHPHTKQQIGGKTNGFIAFFMPFGFILFESMRLKSLLNLHHGMLGLGASMLLADFITVSLKNRVGRLRPDFLARCKWSEALKRCTGKAADIMEGRKSFPSGHSSTAFSGMTFLFLWLSARTLAWNFDIALSRRGPWIFTSRMGRVVFTLLPLLYASWVAISRVEDYRHHKEDVIVGSIIGIACATTGYLAYWPNPFSSYRQPSEVVEPRLLYRADDMEGLNGLNNNGYELTHPEDGRESV